MPNYCENDLKVTGIGKDDFLQAARSDESLFDFNNFIPYPAEWRELDELVIAERKAWTEQPENTRGRYPSRKDGYNSGGYQWCISNWGTKWNASDVRLGDCDEYEINLHFSTAWEPPVPVILAASSKFPQAEFELVYYERGMGFHGILRAQRGLVMEQWQGKYVGNRGG